MKSLSTLKENRFLLVSFAVLQTSLISGIMFGWAGIAGTLLIASPAHGGAGLSLEQTTYIFAMVASTASFSPLLLGIVLDKYGPRFASLLSNIIIAVGIQTIALAESYTAFAIGACTVAFGGPGIQASVVSFANLFPNAQFFVMSIVNGSIAVSFAILPIFNQIWKVYGTSYQAMFQTYLLVVIASGIGSLLLLPDEPFQSIKEDDDLGDLLLSQQEEDDHTTLPQTPPPTRRITPRSMKQAMSPEKLVMESVNHVNHLFEQPLNSFLRSDPSLERHESFMLSKKAIEKGLPGLVSLKDLPFMGQVTSGSYIRSLTVFVVTSFFANFYIAAITTELADFVQEYTVEQQQNMVQTFSLVLSFGILGSFAAGWLMDIMGLETCTLVTLSLGIAHMVTLTMLGNVPMMTIGFVIYTLFRAFLYPVFIACISDKLGFKYFGILMGIGFAVSGIVQLGIAPLANAVQGTCHLQEDYVDGCTIGEWKLLHVIQIISFLLLGILPIWDHRVQMHRQALLTEMIRSQSSLGSYGSMTDATLDSVKRQSSQSTEDVGLTFSLSSSPGTSPSDPIRHGAISPSTTAPGLVAICEV